MAQRSPGLLAGIVVVLAGLLGAFFLWLKGQGFSAFEILCMAPLDVAAYAVMGAMLWLIFTDHEPESEGHR